MEYTIPHTLQFNCDIERQFSVIKEGVLSMLINSKLNDAAQNILWAKLVHTLKRVRSSMTTNNSLKNPFEIFNGENPG